MHAFIGNATQLRTKICFFLNKRVKISQIGCYMYHMLIMLNVINVLDIHVLYRFSSCNFGELWKLDKFFFL